MSLIIDRETPHNALWYTPPGATPPNNPRETTSSRIPSLSPDEYVDLIRHHYRHNA